ncbi:MAG: hypothetical protein R3C68_19025 [Myxococcota bacterium]
MHSRYGGLLRRFFALLFGPIDYPPEAAQRACFLASQGPLVYVTRARSTLLVLYFNHTLERLGLPLARFVGGINLLLWQPLDRIINGWKQRRQTLTGAWRTRFTSRSPTRAESNTGRQRGPGIFGVFVCAAAALRHAR